MAFTPTDPTKAEVRVTGTAPNQELDFYIPRGAKGEPGGIALGADLGGANLNDFKTSGVYRQTNSGNASLLNNYPIATHAGNLVVLERVPNATLTQIFYPILLPETTYVRNMNGLNVWGTWKCHTSTRIDQTAGRAIYTYDYLNSREQLTYGDTGWRDMALDPTYGVAAAGDFFGRPSGGGTLAAGDVRIRRVGNKVFLGGNGPLQPKQDYSSTTNRVCILAPGFRSSGNNDHVICKYGNNGGDVAQRMVFLAAGAFYSSPAYITAVPLIDSNWNNSPTGQAYPKLYHGIWLYGSWITNDAWPTTLPGAALGTIPNT